MASAIIEAGGRGGRRTTDAEINMLPMVDLLMVTIAFLLITAVWTKMARVDASAQAPGAEPAGEPAPPARALHLDMRDTAHFALYWTEGGREVRRTELARRDVVESVAHARRVTYPGLADAVHKEWSEMGAHRAASDRALDQLVLHTDDAASYANVIGAMDAVRGATRPMQLGGKTVLAPAFNVTFSTR